MAGYCSRAAKASVGLFMVPLRSPRPGQNAPLPGKVSVDAEHANG